jgi:homoserine O-acetyltransferase
LTIVTADTRHYGWADKTFGYKWADPAKDPAASIENRFAIADTLIKGGLARARTADANSIIYTARANQLYRLTDDEVKRIKARILFIPARSDLVFPPELSERAAARYRAQGGVAEVAVLEGDGGHLDGVFNVAGQGERIRAFLAR